VIRLNKAYGILLEDDVAAAVTVTLTGNLITPTTAPDGATTYKFLGLM
jgi:hypothetical protein